MDVVVSLQVVYPRIRGPVREMLSLWEIRESVAVQI